MCVLYIHKSRMAQRLRVGDWLCPADHAIENNLGVARCDLFEDYWINIKVFLVSINYTQFPLFQKNLAPDLFVVTMLQCVMALEKTCLLQLSIFLVMSWD